MVSFYYFRENSIVMRTALVVTILFIALSSCIKRPDPIETPSTVANDLRVTISNQAGNSPLSFNTWYLNENGDSFKVEAYKYYISNVVLIKTDGTEFKEPESYHLVDHARSETKSFVIKNVPSGSYNKIKFLIGVDYDRNISGSQTGDLDPIYGMFWDWNTGYIMAKMEGNSPQSVFPAKNIFYHIGGFSGKDHVLRTVELSFPTNAVTGAEKAPNVHLVNDILEWFKTPYTIKISELSGAMTPGEEVSHIADNYADMFKVDHID